MNYLSILRWDWLNNPIKWSKKMKLLIILIESNSKKISSQLFTSNYKNWEVVDQSFIVIFYANFTFKRN